VKPAALVALLAFAGAAQAASTPHAQARTALLDCQRAIGAFHFVARTKEAEPRVRKLVLAAQSACAPKKLKALAAAHGSDDALLQAMNAVVGISDALVNYRKYLDDVAAGKTGHTRILRYAAEEIRQGRLLLTYALSALK
jgi:hypothetical protein